MSTMGLEEAMAGMEDGFINGYQEAQQAEMARAIKTAPRHVRKTRDDSTKAKSWSRAKSVSPTQIRVDPRSY